MGQTPTFWRGKHDFYSTMAGSSLGNATRTKCGVNSAAKFWNMGKLERVLTSQDHIQMACKKVGDIVIQYFHFD